MTTEVTALDAPGLEPYTKLTEAQLRNRLHADEGVFIAESPKVIRIALDAGYEPLSLLAEARHISGDAADIVERIGDVPVFTGSRTLLAQLTGYTLTRGVLCAMRRKPQPPIGELCRDACRIAVLDGIVDTTNIGAIFRSAAALGIDAVALTPTSCDPLNRRAIRVSMGTVFLVPWTWIDADISLLHAQGFKTVAMALTDRSVSITDPALNAEERLAIVLGNEGDGLPPSTIAMANYTVRIPMHHGVDSLNVGAAAAIAFYQLTAPKAEK